MSLEDKIAAYLTENPGKKGSQIATAIGEDRQEINRTLHARLKGRFHQDNQYRWWPAANAHSADPAKPQEPIYQDTPLARLARYYLACLGQDDVGEVSAWARSNYGLDYAALSELPRDGIQQILQEPAAAQLLNKMHSDRSPKILYLGYPVALNVFNSKKGEKIYRLEPVMLLPIQFEQPNNRGTASLTSDFPLMNTAVLKRFSNADQQALMEELLALEDELGFGEGNEVPELEDVVERLQAVRSEWPWQEACDPYDLALAPPIHTLEQPGIYNRAVLLLAERTPYTQGLETELRDLAKLSAASYAHTALGSMIQGRTADAGSSEDRPSQKSREPLVEVLPMNQEQRLAIERALVAPLTIITGPPGTGKSQVVTNLLINAAWQGKTVLFASKNNKAVDVVETRVNNLGPRPLLLRMGKMEYQAKLKQYLQALLAASSGVDELEEYRECFAIHNNLLSKIVELETKQQQFIDMRNRVDAMEQKVEKYRAALGEPLFAKVKTLKARELSARAKPFLHALRQADKSKAGLIDRLFWPLQKSGRYARFAAQANKLASDCKTLNLRLPERAPDDTSFDDWTAFAQLYEELLAAIGVIEAYFGELARLSSTQTLESLNQELRQQLTRLSRNSENLWSGWLKVSPSRLKAQDRQLLSQYVSVLQMITDNGDGKVATSVWRQYYQLTEKVSHLLPCWAVTSLSARGKLPFTAGFYDLVVFDEASQCDIASALPLLYRAKRAVVIGDPKQLGHISSIKRRQDQQLLERFGLEQDYLQWAYSWNSLFDMASSYAAEGDIVNLRDHHRSHADIINFSNEFFYESRLRVATRYDRLARPALDAPGVRWLDVKGQTIRPDAGGAVNRVEALAVVAELKRLVLEQGYRGTIGVVSPFRAQANLIKELCAKDVMLERALNDSEFLSDTVHRFQGDERDLIVFSPVISQGAPMQSLNFLSRNGNLFNVAITRARAALVVIGDRAAARNSGVEYLSEFSRYVDTLEAEQISRAGARTAEDLGPRYPTFVDRGKVSDWEVLLYQALYSAGIRTIPQYPIEQYLLDLALVVDGHSLDIEVDGERYHRNWTGELCRRDQIRNQRLFELGWDVMRFWVYEVRDDLEGCIKKIKQWQEAKQHEQV